MNNTFSIRAAFGIVVVSILSAFLAGGIVLGIGLSNPDSPQKFYTFISFIIGQGFMLVPLIWFLTSRKEPLFKRLRLNPISSFTAFMAVLFSIQIFIPAPEYIVDLNGLLEPDTMVGFILLFVAVSIIAPLGEELLFRGFLQQFLEKHWKDVTRAILVTALVFATIHMNPYWFIQIYILGIMLGFLSWKTGSVFPPLILHGLNNSFAMIVSFADVGENNLYLWNGHVAPWILVLAVGCVVFGFSNINRQSIRS